MKYDHTIKVNGVLYRAGEEVPALSSKTDSKDFSQYMNEPVMAKEEGYTEETLNALDEKEIRALAQKLKIYGAKTKSIAELKKMILEKQ